MTGTLRNTGATAIDTATVHARLSTHGPADPRRRPASWAAGRRPRAAGPVVASQDLPDPLPAGGTASFRLTIPADAVRNGEGFAALPLAVDVDTGPATVARRGPSCRGSTRRSSSRRWPSPRWCRSPSTPTRACSRHRAPSRNAAWAKAVGPGSRLQSVIAGTADAPVTWAIDPAILGPAASDGAVGTAGARGAAPRPRPRPRARARRRAGGGGRRTGTDRRPHLPACLGSRGSRPVGTALRRPGHRDRARRPHRRVTARAPRDAERGRCGAPSAATSPGRWTTGSPPSARRTCGAPSPA